MRGGERCVGVGDGPLGVGEFLLPGGQVGLVLVRRISGGGDRGAGGVGDGGERRRRLDEGKGK
ncbi:hypothetical protein EAW56_03620 [Corynebacterium gottingense]|uniref:Uncharacterized protein n=1 Tax=Corynebacterium gottingense TaxID=2041036 RepID=A0ABX9UKP4_9CORY|nr:hypothetical protein EAW56_03620 [Corynebacterium gottingense]